MVKEVKVGSDVYVFDDWKCADRWPTSYNPGTGGAKWFRRLLTKNGAGYVSEEETGDPRLEILETLTIHRNLFPSFIDVDLREYNTFHKLLEMIYPFPNMYTKADDFDLAKKHCDRYLDAINNLLVFA